MRSLNPKIFISFKTLFLHFLIIRSSKVSQTVKSKAETLFAVLYRHAGNGFMRSPMTLIFTVLMLIQENSRKQCLFTRKMWLGLHTIHTKILSPLIVKTVYLKYGNHKYIYNLFYNLLFSINLVNLLNDFWKF